MVEKLLHQHIFKKNQAYHLAQIAFNNKTAGREHTHNFYELFIVIDGQLNHTKNGCTEIVKKDDVRFIRKTDVHSLGISSDAPKGEIINIAFTDGLLQSALAFISGEGRTDTILHPQGFFSVHDLLFIRNRIDHILHKSLSSNMEGHIRVVLAMVLSGLCDLDTDIKPNIPVWLTVACKKLKTLDTLDQTLPKLIQFSGKTQEHLTRSMKKYMGTTPTQYINTLRLNWIAGLLHSQPTPITKLAFDAGFGNLSHFNKLFREQFGCSPSQYRNNRLY